MDKNTSVRLQTYLSASLYERLQEEARQRRESMAQIVREAVEQYLASREEEDAAPDDPIWQIPDLVAGYTTAGLADGAVDHDRYLYDDESRA